MDFEASRRKVAALVAPKNVVVVGASDRPGNWALRARNNLRRYEFPGNVYLINPRRDEILGEKCYPDFAALPEAPDHLLVVIPAAGVSDALAAGAAAGARSATVFSSGFGEAFDEAGAALGKRLRETVAKTGLGVSGPNCMGNICKPSRLITFTEDRPIDMTLGEIAMVGQSGGVMLFVNQALEERGMSARYMITSGNEAGLRVADYIAFFASEPDVKVVLVYIEAIADMGEFLAACKHARAAGKSIVAVKLGQSEAGRQAALAHTGSLAGAVAAFDAIAADAGVIRADTLDDAVELCELLGHTGAAKGRRLGAVTLSGAYRGLLLDAAERNGLLFPKLAPDTYARLNKVLGVGSMISNPIDGGFGVLQSADTYMECIDALASDPNVDMVLTQEALPREKGSERSEKYIALVQDYIASGKAKKPVSFVTLTSHGQSDHSRALRRAAPRVSFLEEAYKALRAIAATARRAEAEAVAAHAAPAAAAAPAIAGELRALAKAATGAFALDEARSKALLRAYDFPVARETLAKTPAEAAKAAGVIGYPVVLKAVSATLTHKSEFGAVVLNIADANALAAAWSKIEANLASHGFKGALEGMLVGEMVKGGLELVMGLHRDPEAGCVVMAGSGGVLLELVRDVAFAAPPISREKARDLLERTRAAKLVAGFRGSPALDADAFCDALVALGRVARDLGDVIESIDVNPFMLLPKGGAAVDALVVLRGGAN